MKIGIVGAGQLDIDLDPSMDYIGVDGGLESLLNQNIEPKIIVGDFDSLNNQDLIKTYKNIKLPTVKDDTDLAKAIEYAIACRYNDIELYGVTGGRLDHFMAVICLLKKYSHHHITIYDAYNKIYLLNAGTHQILKQNYQYLSFFALKPVTISIIGCQYPLDHYLLDIDDPLCVSNEIINDIGMIEVNEDIIVIQSNNKENINGN